MIDSPPASAPPRPIRVVFADDSYLVREAIAHVLAQDSRIELVAICEDGESLVTLSEWSDRECFQQFRQSEFGRAAVALGASLHPKSYWLRQAAAVEAP